MGCMAFRVTRVRWSEVQLQASFISAYPNKGMSYPTPPLYFDHFPLFKYFQLLSGPFLPLCKISFAQKSFHYAFEDCYCSIGSFAAVSCSCCSCTQLQGNSSTPNHFSSWSSSNIWKSIGSNANNKHWRSHPMLSTNLSYHEYSYRRPDASCSSRKRSHNSDGSMCYTCNSRVSIRRVPFLLLCCRFVGQSQRACAKQPSCGDIEFWSVLELQPRLRISIAFH